MTYQMPCAWVMALVYTSTWSHHVAIRVTVRTFASINHATGFPGAPILLVGGH